MKTIAVDFDGTLCRKQLYGDGEIWQTPNDGAVEVMKRLYKAGYNLIIFTVRLNPALKGNLDAKENRIKEWLIKYDIPYSEVTNHKPSALAYIDDRAIRFEDNWESISNYFLQ